MNITVIGTGYVGLVTGTCLAETGNEVICVDINEEKVAAMRQGKIPIYEPNLDTFFQRNIKANRLSFTTSIDEGVAHGEVIFLALPTPEDENGAADLSYVLDVAGKIGKIIKSYKIIVNKSTVPVGTFDKVRSVISELTSIDFDVVSNPEFLKEGVAVEDFMKPERIIIGSASQKSSEVMKKLYEPYVRSGNPILLMTPRSAELTKYAANSFLATKISFMNEIANFCEKIGANVDDVRRGMGTDSRIGKRFLFPGIGYGGSCFPKDVKALHHSGKTEGFDFKILDSVIDVNHQQKTILFPKIKKHFGDLKGKKIAVWGLAFKPETDDIREAPALYMIDELLSQNAEIVAFDPEAIPNVKRKYGSQVAFANNMYECLENADALLICTEWNIFRTPDINKMKKLMKNPVIFDGRNLYDKQEIVSQGFDYQSIGR